MADLIDIELGDQRIRVPAWATEATLEAVMKYNEITARALNKLVGVSSDGNKTFRIQEHYFKEIVDELKKSKKKQQELVNQNNTIIKDSKTKTTSARSKSQSSTNSTDSFDKKISELSKNYSTSVSLLEGSLLYLSKNLVDLNLVIKQVSDSYKNILPNIKGGASSTRSGNSRSTVGSPSDDDNVFGKEKRDLSFRSLFISFAEDLIERTKSNRDLPFDNLKYMKGIDNLKKAIETGKTKGLLSEDLVSLQNALNKISEGKNPDEKTIKSLEKSLNDFSNYNEEYISVSRRLYNYYIKDTSLSKLDQDNKTSNNVTKALIRSQESITNVGKETILSLKTLTSSALTTGLTFGKVSDIIGKVVGSLPLIGGVLAGVTAIGATVLEEYITGLKELSGVSVGLGSSLTELNAMALQAGMSLADYSKLMSENSSAVKSLGNSTNDGAKQFNTLSKTLRSVARDQYNNFGLTDPEYNKILMEEIDLRRKSGMDSVEIYNAVNGSMNDLLYNTTQLAGMTGQNAREMRRNMIATRQSDATLNLAMNNLSKSGPQAAKNVESVLGIFGKAGESGKQLAAQMLKSADTELDMRVGMSSDLTSALSLSGNIASEISKFIDDNVESMDSEEFNAQLMAMASKLSDNLIEQQNAIYSQAGLQAGKTAIELGSGLTGLNESVTDNVNGMKKIGDDLKSDNAAWMQFPNALEALSLSVKNSTIVATLDTLGLDLTKGGKVAVDALYDIANKITKDGILNTGVDIISNNAVDFAKNNPVAALGGLGIAVTSLVGAVVLAKKALTVPFQMASMAKNTILKYTPFGGQVGGNLVDDAARVAARNGGSLVDDAARVAGPAAATAGSGLAKGLFSTLPIIGDIINGYIHGSETGSIGRGIFAGLGSFSTRAAALVAGTASTGVGGLLTQGAAGFAGGYGGAGLYDLLFGEPAPAELKNATTGYPSNNLDNSYMETLAVHANTTNVWLENLNGISATIRDDISSIKATSGFQNNESVIDILNDSAAKTQAMIRLMSETNRLMGMMIRRYDESTNN